MSVIVTGMDMPECCHWDCELCREDGGACILGTYDEKADTKVVRPKSCPLKSVDGLIEKIQTFNNVVKEDFGTSISVSDCIMLIKEYCGVSE